MKSKVILLSFLLVIPASIHAWEGSDPVKASNQKAAVAEHTNKTGNIEKKNTRDIKRSTTKNIKKQNKRDIKSSTTPTRSKSSSKKGMNDRSDWGITR